MSEINSVSARCAEVIAVARFDAEEAAEAWRAILRLRSFESKELTLNRLYLVDLGELMKRLVEPFPPIMPNIDLVIIFRRNRIPFVFVQRFNQCLYDHLRAPSHLSCYLCGFCTAAMNTDQR